MLTQSIIGKNTTVRKMTVKELLAEVSVDFLWNNLNDNSKDHLAIAVENDRLINVQFIYSEPVAIWIDQEMVD